LGRRERVPKKKGMPGGVFPKVGGKGEQGPSLYIIREKAEKRGKKNKRGEDLSKRKKPGRGEKTGTINRNTRKRQVKINDGDTGRGNPNMKG